MKNWFGSFAIITALLLTACGRDDQGGQQPPVNPNPPIVAPAEQPSVEQPADGYYTEGGVAGRCGFLCRWRMRRQQRRQGCW